jgi:hypothetical protein
VACAEHEYCIGLILQLDEAGNSSRGPVELGWPVSYWDGFPWIVPCAMEQFEWQGLHEWVDSGLGIVDVVV